jgi:hypothetical protein
MFNWLRKQAAEPAAKAPRAGENPANPGIGSVANWTFSDGKRTWQEPMNLIDTLERLLNERGRGIQMEGNAIVDIESQFSLRPLLHTMQPVHQNGVRTSTTIEIKHPTLVVSPVFEYQHSAGPNLEESLMAGFRQWYDSDFITLLDAGRDKAVDCMELAESEHRITLGPLLHGCQLDLARDESEHPPCPCCMFTRTKDAYQPLMTSSGFYALRLYAARDQHGRPIADCRLNGEDYPAGKKALIEYARTWKSVGVESRKQYVVIQDRVRGVTVQ